MTDNQKYTVLTCFGKKCWDSHASLMVESFVKFWPEEVTLVIVADPDCPIEPIRKLLRPGDVVTNKRTPEREEWLKKQKPDEGKDYRKHYIRFSHKVWAIQEAMSGVSGTEYLIWMDSDIITHSPVAMEDIQEWMPKQDASISYMGRKDWDDPETGFIGFKIDDISKGFCDEWYNRYLHGTLLHEKCWTDAHAFELNLLLNPPRYYTNLTIDVSGRDVFDQSPMAARLYHAKGPQRKADLNKPKELELDDPSLVISKKVLDVNNMGIGTVTNMPVQGLCDNIFKNLRGIETWVNYCKQTDEPIIFCSAGPSLNPADILPWVEKGAKIVAVKHALARLQSWGIKPWACLLLDGREHVSGFLESPDKDVLYIAASMVDPAAIKHLNKHRCKVLGYHAHVGNDVMQMFPAGSLAVGGGSATSTRGIDVLYTLGFRNFHIYGMDCCYFEMPNLEERKDNGKLKYMQITLSSETWGDTQVKRTFWTEGQFLAQVQEFKRLYLPRKDIKLHTYGDGIIAWTHKHALLHQEWKELYNARIDKQIKEGPLLEDVIRGIDESRNSVI